MSKKSILLKLSIVASSTLCYADVTLEDLNFYNNTNSYNCTTSAAGTNCINLAAVQNITSINNGNPLKALTLNLTTTNDYLQSLSSNTTFTYTFQQDSYLENLVIDGTGLTNPVLETSTLELTSFSPAGRKIHIKNLEVNNATLKLYDKSGWGDTLVRWLLRVGSVSDNSTSYIILNNGHLDIESGGDFFTIDNPYQVILHSYGTSSINNWIANNPIDASFLFNINTGSDFTLNTNGGNLKFNSGAANIYGNFTLSTSGLIITPNSTGVNIYDGGTLTLENNTNVEIDGNVKARGTTPIFDIDNTSSFDILGFDFRVNTTTPSSSDKLTFFDVSSHSNQQILSNNKVKIEVNPMNTGTVPSDYDGKVFKVIDNQDSGTTYTNTQIDSMYEFVAGGNLPVLTDLTLGTDNSYDVVLTGATLPVSSFKTHNAINTVNKTAGAALLVNAINTNSSSSITSALNSLTNSQASSSVDSIHAEPYSSFITVGLEQIDLVISSVQDKTEKHFSNNKNFWLDMSYVKGNVNGKNNLGDFKYKLNTFLLGSDIIKDEDFNVGFFTGYGYHNMSEHDLASQSFSSNNFHLGLYAYNKVDSNSHLTGMIGYTYGRNSTERDVVLATLSNKNKAEFNSHSIYSSLEFAYDINSFENVKISPNIGLNYAYYQQEEIKEKGNDSRLIVDKADAHMIVSSLGINAKFNSIKNFENLFPTMFVKYEHDWYANKNKERTIDAALAINPNYKESFIGQNRGADSLHFGIGLESKAYNNLDISGGIVSSHSEHGKEVSLGINIKYNF